MTRCRILPFGVFIEIKIKNSRTICCRRRICSRLTSQLVCVGCHLLRTNLLFNNIQARDEVIFFGDHRTLMVVTALVPLLSPGDTVAGDRGDAFSPRPRRGAVPRGGQVSRRPAAAPDPTVLDVRDPHAVLRLLGRHLRLHLHRRSVPFHPISL